MALHYRVKYLTVASGPVFVPSCTLCDCGLSVRSLREPTSMWQSQRVLMIYGPRGILVP